MPTPLTAAELATAVQAQKQRSREKAQARYKADLDTTLREVEQIYLHWKDTLAPDIDPDTALISAVLLTIATLDNMPEDLP